MISGLNPGRDFDGDAVIMMSGGPDSLAIEAVADERHGELYNVFVHFGQEANNAESIHARRISNHYDADLREVRIGDEIDSLYKWGERTGAFDPSEQDVIDDPSLYYIPMRYLEVITKAGQVADMTGAEHIYWGIHTGGGVAPDVRPEVGMFMENALTVSTGKDLDFNFVYPFIGHTRGEVLSYADDLDAPWEKSYSCFKDVGGNSHCGECHSCHERQDKFEEAGIDDPTEYRIQ